MQHFAHIWPIYEQESSHASVRYDLGTVLAKYDVPNQFIKLWTYPQLSSARD